jgi:hypothetical protein
MFSIRRDQENQLTRFMKSKLEDQNMMMGRMLCNQQKSLPINLLKDAEFKVFSQWGDDGIIQYLINHIHIDDKIFIEFGVGDYGEANTRFLLMNNNWRGLIMDASEEYMNKVRSDDIYWRYELIAISAFITQENINHLIDDAGFDGEIGLLHIDIDGVDWWVWRAIDIVSPIIVVVEYNALFGVDRAITVPYSCDFCRTKAHYSNLFAGASLLSFCDLAEQKGYDFVGCNSVGNNAYYIRKDKMGDMKRLTPQEGFICSKFRESRNQQGSLSYVSGEDRINLIRGFSVYNTREDRLEIL